MNSIIIDSRYVTLVDLETFKAVRLLYVLFQIVISDYRQEASKVRLVNSNARKKKEKCLILTVTMFTFVYIFVGRGSLYPRS